MDSNIAEISSTAPVLRTASFSSSPICRMIDCIDIRCSGGMIEGRGGVSAKAGSCELDCGVDGVAGSDISTASRLIFCFVGVIEEVDCSSMLRAP